MAIKCLGNFLRHLNTKPIGMTDSDAHEKPMKAWNYTVRAYVAQNELPQREIYKWATLFRVKPSSDETSNR